MLIQLGFAALFIVLSFALVVGTLNIAGIFIAALLGSNSNDIEDLYTGLGKASTDRDNKKS